MLMERIRREYPNRDWTYFNAATEGWSSYQGVRQLERDILNLKPKIITIYFGWNDHWIHFGIEDKEVLAIHSSWLFKLQELRIAQLLMRAWVAAEGRKTNRSQLRVSESDFRKNLTAMVDLARSQGITPILLTAPTSHQQGQEPVHLQGRWIANLADLIPVHQLYVSIVREVAQEKNVALCDLEKSFKVLLDKDQLRECFSSDGIHLRLEGDRIIAELLYDLLLAKKLIESP
jgi:lysophospholipase L1-like esterase